MAIKPTFKKLHGTYPPILVTIPAGQTASEIVEIGRASIMNLFVKGFVGSITYKGYNIKEGRPSAPDLWEDWSDDNLANYELADLQKPDTLSAADPYYTNYVKASTLTSVPVDYTVFMAPHYIQLNLDVAQAVDVFIEIILLDVV